MQQTHAQKWNEHSTKSYFAKYFNLRKKASEASGTNFYIIPRALFNRKLVNSLIAHECIVNEAKT